MKQQIDHDRTLESQPTHGRPNEDPGEASHTRVIVNDVHGGISRTEVLGVARPGSSAELQRQGRAPRERRELRARRGRRGGGRGH